MSLMDVVRYCGHREKIKVPATKDGFLLERGRTCIECQKRKDRNRDFRSGRGFCPGMRKNPGGSR